MWMRPAWMRHLVPTLRLLSPRVSTGHSGSVIADISLGSGPGYSNSLRPHGWTDAQLANPASEIMRLAGNAFLHLHHVGGQ
jgi:hypothetical protein